MRKLTRQEVLTYTEVVAGAGNETTGRLIGWLGKVLGDHPDQRREIVEDRSLIPNVIDETLRFEPTGPHVARYVARDVEYYGTTMPEGSAMLLLVGAANRDERRFATRTVRHPPGRRAAPDVRLRDPLLPRRGLARLEGRVALDEMLNRFPEWDVDYDGLRALADFDGARLGAAAPHRFLTAIRPVPPNTRRSRRAQPNTTLTTQRLEMLSDGVIAIAATLLVLEIGRVELDHDEDLLEAIGQLWPSYLAYVVSFTVIGLIWVAHHTMFERISSVDRPLLFLNLALLLGIGFIPWPTSVLADFIREDNLNASVATALYSFTMTLIGIVFVGMWAHLVRHPEHTIDTVTEVQLRRSMRLACVSPIVYGATIGLAFVSPYLCLVVYLLLALYFARGPSARALVVGQETSKAPDG